MPLLLTEELYCNPPGVSVSLHAECDPYRKQIPAMPISLGSPQGAEVGRVLDPVARALMQIHDPRMTAETKDLIEQLRIELASFDLRDRPSFSVTHADDGSVLIEWLFQDRRLGFTIEPKLGDSGWYFASSRESGGRCASGALTDMTLSELIRWSLKPLP